MRKIFTLLAVLFLLFAIPASLQLIGLEWRGFFQERRQNIETAVFKQTEQYNESINQELAKLLYEYKTSAEDDDQKLAIKAIIRQRYADTDPNKITSPELKQFLKDSRGY